MPRNRTAKQADTAVDAVFNLVPRHRDPQGQLLFARETRLTRWLHNHTAFTLQQRFFRASLPFVVLPIRVDDDLPRVAAR